MDNIKTVSSMKIDYYDEYLQQVDSLVLPSIKKNYPNKGEYVYLKDCLWMILGKIHNFKLEENGLKILVKKINSINQPDRLEATKSVSPKYNDHVIYT